MGWCPREGGWGYWIEKGKEIAKEHIYMPHKHEETEETKQSIHKIVINQIRELMLEL